MKKHIILLMASFALSHCTAETGREDSSQDSMLPDGASDAASSEGQDSSLQEPEDGLQSGDGKGDNNDLWQPEFDSQGPDALKGDAGESDISGDISDIGPEDPETEERDIDPHGDSDQDGVLDLDEISDGTDPFDPRSCRSLRPDIEGHPRLYMRADAKDAMRLRSLHEEGPFANLYASIKTRANATPPLQNGEFYQTNLAPQQAQIAEAAAFLGYLEDDLAYSEKALDAITASYPDPAPLLAQSQFGAKDNYNLYESEALIQFCSAYDFLLGSEGLSESALHDAGEALKTRIDLFKGFCMASGGCSSLLRGEKNNHSLKALAAIGTCALVFPERQSAIADFHDAFSGIYDIAHEIQGEAEGGWAENWNYLSYSSESHLAFFAALANLARERQHTKETPEQSPWLIHGKGPLNRWGASFEKILPLPSPHLDPLWKGVYRGAIHAIQPDGRTLNVDDGHPSDLHGGLLYAFYKDPPFSWNWERRQYASGRLLVSSFLMYPDDASAAPPQELDVFFKDAGFSVLRSSHERGASFFHIQHEPEKMRFNGTSHEHADPLSFVLWARGEPLAIDPGYTQYSERNLFKYGKDHNIVLVDQEGPEFFLDGLLDIAPYSDGYLHDHAISPPFTTLGTSTKYQEAELRRRVIRVSRSTEEGEDGPSPDLFIIVDKLISEETRKWTFQLNGFASEDMPNTSFSLSEKPGGALAIWERPKASLHAYTVAPSPATASSRLEENDAGSKKHRMFTLSADMAEEAGFLTFLVPLPKDAEAPLFTASQEGSGLLSIQVETGELELQVRYNSRATAVAGLPPLGLEVLLKVGESEPQSRSYSMDMPEIPDIVPYLDF